ncbi:MAG TPA: endolytic transglycosylase MltG [Persephonella sp.]|uniref:Endolytic murein transglycosylase n=1 Tax=Persephonella marina (strain DSM 14350 / EX-H1) TaxID=123214 RepID=C0QS38_PERMH|nr:MULTISPECIES: endolytic transglycosylase MltG [Persephonella]ACO03906.1 aminodeoxychorismate lyase [Persephonella marina EX-H1]HCB69229.1 endolytic transglycosylase MltG [Persephonella sp.]
MVRLLKYTFFFISTALFLALLMYIYIIIPHPVGKEKTVFIQKGKSLKEISSILEKEGIIKDGNIFLIYSLLRNKPLKAGYYRFKGAYSVKDVWDILYEGREQIYPFTIIPGEDLFDIAEKLESEGFVKKREFLDYVLNRKNVEKSGLKGISFEGYFPPETYFLSKNSDVEYIVKAFLKEFKKKYLPFKEQFEKKGIAFYKGMIIASMVEKESPVDEEKPVIAGIIIKRLKKNMPLQIDPTVIYSLKLEGRWDGKLGGDIMRFDSPYNTYINKGLPPTPISSFSLESLKAVLNYRETDYLYYFSPDGKRHIFSKTYREHLRKLKKYR